MATEGPMLHDGSQTTAGADLSAKQFFAVKLSTSTDRTVALASTGGEVIYGILQNKPTSGQAADVCIFGLTKCFAGAAVTRGDLLTTDTSGRAITATSGKVAWGQALESAGAASVLFLACVTGMSMVLQQDT